MVNQNSLVKDFRNLGVCSGDIIVLHSDISKIKSNSQLNNKNDACELLMRSLLKCLGNEGTLLVPTFTYKFCSSRIFNPLTSPSEVGIFSNYFLLQEEVERSSHPVFSFAASGKQQDYFIKGVSSSAFGKDSIFERFHEENAKILFVNAGFQSCTFVHYIEEKIGVGYRYMKRFEGEIILNEIGYSCFANNMVRNLDGNTITDLSEFERDLLKNNELTRIYSEAGELLITSCKKLFATGAEKLMSDETYFLKR